VARAIGVATATGLSVVDATTDSLVASLPVGTLLPDGSRYWTVDPGDRTTVRGIDPATGAIIDARHPQRGASISGRVLVMKAARGSSSSSSVLAEAVRAGTAPAAILLGEPDLILAVGAAVGEELYGRRVPIVLLSAVELARIVDGASVRVVGAEVTTADDGHRPSV